ncbi:MAG TPA: YqiA/YcfP family alpha/beta fold hydrolase [Candidatus Saccharimonadales bacterium]|nr:YqiA/YcfP family alpha/beta fold hydrolase [Candidatus Saccharimonadales bacterium]
MIRNSTIPCLGYTLQADFHEGVPGSGVLLVFVGFGGSKEDHASFIARIVALSGKSAVVVNLSGQGEGDFSMKEMTAGRHILEAVEAFEWVKAKHGSVTALMGTSYGGYIAAYLSLYRFIPKLILRTPALYPPEDLYTSHQDRDRTHTRLYTSDMGMVRTHPLFLQTGAGKEKNETLLIVHGRDELVLSATTDAYGARFATETYVAEGFMHRFNDPSNPSEARPTYYEAIGSFIGQ